jgi:hypothetical protein
MQVLKIIGYKRFLLLFRKRAELARVSVLNGEIAVSSDSEVVKGALQAEMRTIVQAGLVLAPMHKRETRGAKRIHYALAVPITARDPRFLLNLHQVLIARPVSVLAGHEIIWGDTSPS